MLTKTFALFFIGLLIIQSHTEAHEITREQIVKYKTNILNDFNETIKSTLDTITNNMRDFEKNTAEIGESVIKKSFEYVLNRVAQYKEELVGSHKPSRKDVVARCFLDEGQLDALEERINEEIKNCVTSIQVAVVNVASDSVNEAQVFMTSPEIIVKDIEDCGRKTKCLETISGNAIIESREVPWKVATLAARIQDINLRTVVSINECWVVGLKEVTDLAFDILEDVFYCIKENIGRH